MKILFIAHRMPYPPDKGDKLRAFNQIKHLSKKHDIYLVSLYDDRDDAAHASEVRKFCKEAYFYDINPSWAKIKGLFGLLRGRPATLGYFHSVPMQSKIDELIRSGAFDLIFTYSSSMAQYVMDAGTVKVMDFVDCDSAKWRQYSARAVFPFSLIYAREQGLLREYEKKIVEKFDRTIVATDAERKEFSMFSDARKFEVLPNGVDTDFFMPIQPSGGKRIVFTGAMDYYANADGAAYFCGEIFPIIKRRCPEAEFYIVGRKPIRSVVALGKKKGVFVTGYVKDVRDYLRNMAVSVVPLRIAQGVQNKILEAMASGLPVVTSSKALAGIGALPGRDLVVADSPEDFAERTLALLSDNVLRKTIGDNARRFVEENHNWEKNLSLLDKILEKVSNERPGRTVRPSGS